MSVAEMLREVFCCTAAHAIDSLFSLRMELEFSERVSDAFLGL